jgi:hypothetical protein
MVAARRCCLLMLRHVRTCMLHYMHISQNAEMLGDLLFTQSAVMLCLGASDPEFKRITLPSDLISVLKSQPVCTFVILVVIVVP